MSEPKRCYKCGRTFPCYECGGQGHVLRWCRGRPVVPSSPCPDCKDGWGRAEICRAWRGLVGFGPGMCYDLCPSFDEHGMDGHCTRGALRGTDPAVLCPSCKEKP